MVLLDILKEDPSEKSFSELKKECSSLTELLKVLELKSFLGGPNDKNDCYVAIHAGAGGTEAADWAGILQRMYFKWAEQKKFSIEILSLSEAEEAGIRSVSFLVKGLFAYGYLQSETGVHRLVRISPFDANARRHTSFASVFVWPDVDDDIEVVIKEEDLKVDTYRASGAGGQHVNKTDSAVRITHLPTDIVVQCQSQRSQHANRNHAMKMLKAALYNREEEKRKKEKESIESSKKANEWGSQIRSYVLHPYQMVKDHRTQWEAADPSAVLNGGLDPFISAWLKSS
jgi:peptide chain release factor 2